MLFREKRRMAVTSIYWQHHRALSALVWLCIMLSLKAAHGRENLFVSPSLPLPSPYPLNLSPRWVIKRRKAGR